MKKPFNQYPFQQLLLLHYQPHRGMLVLPHDDPKLESAKPLESFSTQTAIGEASSYK